MNTSRLSLRQLGTTRALYFILTLLAAASFLVVPTAGALTQSDIRSLIGQYPYYDPDAGGVGNGIGEGPVSGGDSCLNVGVPSINNPDKLAEAINAFIDKYAGSGPFKNLGKDFVEGAIRAGVNPMLVVAIGMQESTLAAAKRGVSTVEDGHNAFGRSAGKDNPPNFFYETTGPDWWYEWESWLLSINDPNGDGNEGDEPSFLKKEYLSDPVVITLLNFTSKYVNGDPNDPSASVNGDPVGYANNLEAWMSEMISAAGDALSCGVSGVSGSASSIVQYALLYAWPGPHNPETEGKPEYLAAPPTASDAGNCYGADCGVFVSTVMRRSGADPNYPVSGTSNQESYIKTSDRYDWVQLGPGYTTADLQPGDILIVSAGAGQVAAGHTYIYVGPQPVSGYNEASASWSKNCDNSRMPSLGKANILDPLGRGYYLRARLK